MNILEAKIAHEAGKKVVHESFSEGEYVLNFYNDCIMTNQQDRNYGDKLEGWRIIEELLTVEDYQKGLDFIYKLTFYPSYISVNEFQGKLADFINGKRIWRKDEY